MRSGADQMRRFVILRSLASLADCSLPRLHLCPDSDDGFSRLEQGPRSPHGLAKNHLFVLLRADFKILGHTDRGGKMVRRLDHM